MTSARMHHLETYIYIKTLSDYLDVVMRVGFINSSAELSALLIYTSTH